MTEIKSSGLANGTNAGLVTGSIGGTSDSVSVTAFRTPDAASGLPRITGDQFSGGMWSLDTAGLTGITAYDWRIVGGATQGTASVLDTTGLTGQWIECRVTCDQGAPVTPAKMVYMGHMPGHDADDRQVLALVPHEAATHIAVTSGPWTDAATWHGGRVPGLNARVLIPHDVTVTYDNTVAGIRLDWIRVDGTLAADLTQSVTCLFETLVNTRGATFTDGIGGARRPASTTSEWIISSRDYRLNAFTCSELDFMGDDNGLFGRGIINQGVRRMWGAEKTAWLRTAAGGAPMAGDTSLTLADTPLGWQIGDRIAIGGTSPDLQPGQTEQRTITALNGAVLSWDEPLRFDHDHHNPNVTRTDLQPGVANLRRNVVIRSEDPDAPVHMRGHTMDMHMQCWQDLWDVEHRDLGRTHKETIQTAGNEVGRQDGTTFYYMVSGDSTSSRPMTPTANVKSRYPIHNHICGFGKANVDTVNGCVVRGTPGWGMVHHGCEARYNRNVIVDFAGAGMVGETGDEIGEWLSNFVAGSLTKSFTQPKTVEGIVGLAGNTGKHGYAFHMHGRAIRVNGNFAMDCTSGFNFYHRMGGVADAVSVPHPYAQPVLDLKDLRGPRVSQNMPPRDYPIVHWADNEAAGCAYGGFTVTKGISVQNHGVNINLKRFKVWGIGNVGLEMEYIVQYAVTDLDAVGCFPAPGDNRGTQTGGNVAQVAWVNPRTEGCTAGIRIDDSSATYPHADFNTTTEPKYLISGHTSIGDKVPVDDRSSAAVTRIWATTPRFTEPVHNLPFKLADWSGGTLGAGAISNVVTGLLTDSVGTGSGLPKFVGKEGLGMPRLALADAGYPAACLAYLLEHGYWQIGGANYIVFPLYFSDRLSAKPIKTWHGIEFTGPTSGAVNNGTYTVSANAPAVTAANMTVTRGGSATLDILALATDVDGRTLTLSDSYFLPDHGRVAFNGGEITYTSDPFGYTGTDIAYFWVENGAGHSTRVDLNITVVV